MPTTEAALKARIDKMRSLVKERNDNQFYQEAVNLGLTVLHDTTGASHPLMGVLREASKSNDYMKLVAGARAVIELYDTGGLTSPRLAIAHEIESDILDVAQTQVSSGEKNTDLTQRQMQYAIAAFLAGAALEDGLRRLADSRELTYDRARTTLAKLQAVLYQPGSGIEIISNGENKQITSWGNTRNDADHGHFDQITHTDVLTMVMGVRAFLDKHLP